MKRDNSPHVISPDNTQPGFYRAGQVAELLGVGRSTFWLWSQQKIVRGIAVPQPIKLSAGVTVWKRADVHQFIDKLSSLGDSTPPEAA